VFVSSYVGASIVWLGECIIKRVPLIKHIYSASKQISNAISPGVYAPLMSLKCFFCFFSYFFSHFICLFILDFQTISFLFLEPGFR